MNTPRTDALDKKHPSPREQRDLCVELETELADAKLARDKAQEDWSETAILLAQEYAKLKKCRTALEKIASWDEGAAVTSSFDEPHSATIAREALDQTK